jgi:endoglucanase
MRHVQSIQLLAALLFTTQVAAHGHVTNIVINGVSYRGWNIDSDPYNPNPPVVVGWQTPNTANGFVSPDAYGTSDIICHLNATNARGHAVVAAGDKISIQWTTWPDSHHGPVCPLHPGRAPLDNGPVMRARPRYLSNNWS